MMKMIVHCRGGLSAIFTVPEDILAVDFAAMAGELGRIRKVEFV